MLSFTIKNQSKMLRLRSAMQLINQNHHIVSLRRYSIKEDLRKISKEAYANHEHLLYSSYLECRQKETFVIGRRKWQKEHSNKWCGQLTADEVDKLTEELRQKYSSVLSEENEVSFERTTKDVELITDDTGHKSNGYPKNWMEDYEFYEGAVDADGNLNATQGTADPMIAPSRVPCNGCGAHLHCANPSLPGFIPREIFIGRTRKELQTIICQRCHFLKYYNIALDVEVLPDMYIDTISRISDQFALAIVIVDLLDFPCSIWPGMQKLLGPKRPVFVVGNKVDLLPRDSVRYLEHVKKCLEQEMVQSGFNTLNIKYVSLISAKTGYGIEELITQLHTIWKYKGDVYLLGCTNVGKSSLFNILLNSDYCRPEATNLVRKATTCPWPGTTLQMLKFPILRPSEIRVKERHRRLFSESAQRAAEVKLRRDQARKTGSVAAAQLIGDIGRSFVQKVDVVDAFSISSGTQPIVTLDERSPLYQQAKWCYDTPGVMQPDQTTNLLTTEELLQLMPSQMISPRGYRLKSGNSVLLAGLARLDLVDCTQSDAAWIKILIFCSLKLPVVITEIEKAQEVYTKYIGTPILGVPCGSDERLKRWPGLQCKPELFTVTGDSGPGLSCDIMLSSVGWVGLVLPPGGECTFRAWTPNARGIYLRKPALIPQAHRLIGKRIRESMAYNLAKPFVFKKHEK